MAFRNYMIETKESFNTETLYREIASYLYQKEFYAYSLRFFDEAIAKNSDDLKSLLQRSECRAKLGRCNDAMRDIEHAVSLFPNNTGVLVQKSFISYLCCEFERSILDIYKTVTPMKREDCSLNTIGYCYDAINNCVGDAAGYPLRDHYGIIKRKAWKKNFATLEEEKPKKRKRPPPFFKVENEDVVSTIEKKIKTPKQDPSRILDSFQDRSSTLKPSKSLHGPFPFRPLQSYTKNIENYMAEKYLEVMANDRKFLKNLPNAHGIDSLNQGGVIKIREIAKSAYKTVSTQQEILRTRRPFYCIKYLEAGSKHNVRAKMEALYVQRSTLKEADMLLAKVEKAEQANDYRNVLVLAERFQRFCDSKPKKFLPNKNEYIEKIVEIVCDTYYKMKRINQNQYPWDQIKRIQKIFDLPVSREPSNDSIIGHLGPVFVDANKKIELFEKRLNGCEDSNDRCMCFYELCR